MIKSTSGAGDILPLTNKRPQAVAIVDGNGDQITNFGGGAGGTQYSEDTPSAAAEQLTMAGVVRKNTATSLVDTDGDRTELIVDENGRLHSIEVNSASILASVDGVEGILTTMDADTGILSASVSTAGSAVPSTGQMTHGSDGTNARAIKTDTSGNIVLAAGTNTNEVVGDVAQDVAAAGNPVQIGLVASTAIPTAMGADGRVVRAWANRNGAQVITLAPHVGLNSDPWNLQYKAAQYTSQQTSTVLQAGAANEKIVVTQCQIQAFGTTTFDLQVYFGTGAFSRGTNRAIFDGTFKPSSTLAPGAIQTGPFISGTNGDDVMVTTSAAGSVTIGIWYYIVT